MLFRSPKLDLLVSGGHNDTSDRGIRISLRICFFATANVSTTTMIVVLDFNIGLCSICVSIDNVFVTNQWLCLKGQSIRGLSVAVSQITGVLPMG